MPSDVEFRQLLIDLDDEMSNDERKRFIFLLGNDIPKRKRDEPLVDIFTILIDRGRISETNCNYLVELLERTKLTTLAYKVARYSTKHTPLTSVSTVLESSQATDNVNGSSTGTIDNVPKDTPTLAELVNDINSEDSMILSESEQNTPTDIKSMTVQPDLASMFLENIDLKVFENDTWSDDFLKKINVNIHPYEYQRELVQSAIQAGNTIICLRTGGGKTLVAGNLRILACDENYDITKYLKSYDVIICTPHKLLNCLKAKTISMSDIDLLCYDECHDTVVRNQYIGIMQYIMCRDVDHIPSTNLLPIIIGLTAVVDLHRSSPVHKTNHLTVLCAIFNCFTITSVLKKDNEAELEKYVCRTSEDEIICITKQKKFDILRLSIEKELSNLILQLFLSKDTNPLRIFPEKDIEMNGYEQSLEILKQSEQKKQHFPSVILINYILAIYRHLRSLADLTPDLVLSDLKDYFEMTYKSREHPIAVDTLIYNKCQSLLKTKLTDFEESEQILLNPKLDKLVELLKKHAEKPNSRALILVERTFYAQKICEFLQNQIELKSTIKPCWLISQNGLDSKKSNKSEDSVLIDFRNGVYNVMISTDVVRAGLDIPECSLVLRYDFVPDSIGTVQARVRARRTNCVYYLITTKDSQNYIKELGNRQCEQDLKEVLETWKQIPSHEFKERVLEKQTSLIKEWSESLTKALATEKIVSENTELIGDVLCRACGYHLGKLSRLRQYGQSYFINDHDFYNRIEEKILPEPREYVTTSVTGKALCGSKNCRAKLGCIQTLKDHSSISPIYPLKCQSIKIKLFERENGSETMILKKKWKQMLFKIPPLEISCSKNDEDIYYDAYDVMQTDV
ncbi:unnamed protein product [Rotaria magnacalcarata]|uniref:RNA helicase n=3 Tax=Rotaria magnacalcarata TaxID=392030 RepID=A0A818XCT9_9BILA|nr:unnamed protein product [Rotaria magnacalcarata]CAF3729006.1 unnamed protein product [Rotaria magnacalcarata]CAF3735549.1 unnamed protein product [Rotaria magnacalcarata]